jgi:hypothetical protein
MTIKKKEVSNEVIEKPSQELIVIDMDQYAGMGSEEVKAEDLSIPFLRIAQPLSPQVVEEGTAKAGDFINSATMENYGNEIKVVVVGYNKRYNHWKSQDFGGGFLGSFRDGDPLVTETKKKGFQGAKAWIDEETYLAETFNFGVIITSNNNAQVIFPLTSSGIKTAKKWLTFMQLQVTAQGKTKAFFHREYTLTTLKQSKKVGSQTQTWYEPVFKPSDFVTNEALVNQAVAFNNFFKTYQPKTGDMVNEAVVEEAEFDG